MSLVFPIEAGHVLMFARALGETEECYELPGVLNGEPLRVLAPPTFVIASAHFDPDYAMRPRYGMPWKGSGAEPQGTETVDDESPLRLYAEQHFDYHAPVHVGDTLLGTRSAGRSWTKVGRSGRLDFEESVVEWSHSGGGPAVTARRVVVAAAPGPPPRSQPAQPPTTPSRPSERDELIQQIVLVENLRRSTLVQYAGASGDFNPLHTDEVYATQVAKGKSVLAHGMLTMGLAARGLKELGVSYSRLARLGVRFRGQVWPGDTLTLVAAHPPESTGDLSFAVVNDAGGTVLTGSASLGVR